MAEENSPPIKINLIRIAAELLNKSYVEKSADMSEDQDHERNKDIGKWWNLIRGNQFSFIDRIHHQEEAELFNDDLLMYKYLFEEEGRKFTKTHYFVINQANAIEVKKSDIDDLLHQHFLKYLTVNQKIPFRCEVKVQKNGAINVKFSPTDYDSFSFKIEPTELKQENVEAYLNSLPRETKDPLNPSIDQEFSIKPITQSAIISQVASESGTQSVCVFDAIIIEKNLRKSTFQEHVTIFYILRVKGGQAAPDTKKSTLRRDFDEINVKCSDTAMENTQLNVGNIISFKGKLNSDKKAGLLIQNIRKFEKKGN